MAASSEAEYGTFEVTDKELPNPVATPQPTASKCDTLVTAALFLAWWLLASQYNVDNKRAITATPAPLTIATVQCYIGCLWFLPLWFSGLRPMPTFHSWSIFMSKIVPQGVFHGMAHWGGVASMGAGALTFTQIIKSCEPVTTSFFSIFVLGYVFSIWTNLALIPILAGVCLASVKTVEFKWYAFITAMISNCGASLRGVYAKKTMSNPKEVGTNLDSANVFSVITLVFSIIFTPLFIWFEGGAIFTQWGAGRDTFADSPSTFTIVRWIVQSGIAHYAYNEVSFRALGRVNQLTHAVGNTLKRVFTVAWGMIILNEKVSGQASIGCVVAIIGTFLFSLAKAKFG